MIPLLVAIVLAAADDVELGAAIVCAEARGAEAIDRALVAGVLRNRARAAGKRLADVALAPKQFAAPCPPGAVTDGHRLDYLRGWFGVGLPAWWSGNVLAFQTPRSAVRARWEERYGWERACDGRGAHWFYVGAL